MVASAGTLRAAAVEVGAQAAVPTAAEVEALVAVPTEVEVEALGAAVVPTGAAAADRVQAAVVLLAAEVAAAAITKSFCGACVYLYDASIIGREF
jgi:hypothetical protein